MHEFFIVAPPVDAVIKNTLEAAVPLVAVPFVFKIFTLSKTTGLVDCDLITESLPSTTQLLILTLFLYH